MIFVDTGPLLARYLTRDARHGHATRGFARIAHESLPCCTSSFVLDETFTLLGRHAGHAFAAARARAIYASDAFSVLRPGIDEELEAVELLENFAEQSVSFTDCVSFALMRRARIEHAFTFDRHFALAGFRLWPA